ncbi:MAG: TrmH family RNA methyltransferase [bacterium]
MHLSIISRIKEDSRFSKKRCLTLIDDLESFKVLLDLGFGGLVKAIFVTPKFEKLQIIKHFKNVQVVSKQILAKILEIDNPSLCAIIDISDLINRINQLTYGDDLSKLRVCLVLDSIQNPWNLGGMFRNNSAFGVLDVILVGNCVFPYNPRVIRASKGYVFEQKIRMTNYQNLAEFIKTLINQGINYRAYFLQNRLECRDISTLDFHGLVNCTNFFILGNEEKGISRELYEIFKNYQEIRIDVRIDSLNVFATHSIICFLINQRLRI